MTQRLSETLLNAMADAADLVTVGLHSDDPGADGTANEVSGGGYARQSATFGAASGGVRTLSEDVEFSGPASGAVTWFSVWSTGGTFLGASTLTGDQALNASGEYTLTTGTTLTLAAS